MRKTIFSVAALAIAGCLFLSCANNGAQTTTAETQATAASGAIVYFNLDEVLQQYDMANDLRSVVETKAQSIQQEITRRGSKLEKDINSFQDKINKGLLISSVAQAQQEKLQQQQAEFQQYAAQKQQEIAEEQQVMMNQIADAIKTYLETFNAQKGYAMILTTQGGNLPTPVAAGDPSLDVTKAILEGLNAEYVKTKSKSQK